MEAKKYTEEFLINCYKDLNRVRSFDEVIAELFMQGYMSGNIHTCVGQEAITVGGIYAMGKEDMLLHSHRGHGQAMLKGIEPNILMAELFGKAKGCCRGKGGSMHISDMDLGIISSNGIVGEGLPMATGSALASKIKNDGKVTLCFFGDAAANTGCFHEALNLASAWNLPVVFFCENNQYGVSVHIDRVTNIKDLSLRAQSYGIEGITIDGNNVLQVYETLSYAIEKARKGEGPTLIEGKTFRYHGHFVGDPQVYKSKEEIEYWIGKDPIKNLKNIMLEQNVTTEEELTKIEINARDEMEKAAKYGMDAPYPDLKEAFMDIYANDNDRCVF